MLFMPGISEFQYEDEFRGYSFRPIKKHLNVGQRKAVA